MRRTTATALALVGLGLLPATATAKGPFIELSSTPTSSIAGEPWIVQFSQQGPDGPVPPPAGETPTVVITKDGTGESLSFRARPAPGDERYQARVVFPSAGTWSYRVDGYGDGPVHQAWDPVEILASEPPAAAAPAADADSGSSRPWGIIVGGCVLVGALASAGWWLIRRRTGPAFS